MKRLLVYNSPNDLLIEEDAETLTYQLGLGKVKGPKVIPLNDPDRINELALELKSGYCDFIYSLNQEFLKKNFLSKEGFSLFFLSDLSNKRQDVFDTYLSICHLLMIKEKIQNEEIDQIILKGVRKPFVRAAFSLFARYNIVEQDILPSKKRSVMSSLIRSSKFFFDAFMTKIYLIFSWKNPDQKVFQKVFLTFYPLHLKKNGKDIKYGEMVGEKDAFFVSLLADGMHQELTGSSYRKALKELTALKQNVFLLESYLSFFDILRGLFSHLALVRRKESLFDDFVLFEGIDVKEFLDEELDISFKRIPRLMMYIPAIQRFFREVKVQEFYYILHEFCFGRLFTITLSRFFPEVKRIGVQHGGPISQRRLSYALARGEMKQDGDGKEHLPTVDAVLCEDRYTKKIYQAAGYEKVQLMPEVYRLWYLKGVERPKPKEKPSSVLIACGLHDGWFMLESLLDEIRSRKDVRYLLKLHPKVLNEASKKRIEDLGLSNLVCAEGQVLPFLKEVDEVIVTESSVGYEAHLLGIPVRVLNLTNKINESPLLDILQREKVS